MKTERIAEIAAQWGMTVDANGNLVIRSPSHTLVAQEQMLEVLSALRDERVENGSLYRRLKNARLAVEVAECRLEDVKTILSEGY